MEKDSLQNLNQFIDKVNQSKKDNQLDLSSDEDLSIAIMNLVSIEEHFFFTAQKTGKKEEYFELLRVAREMRKDLLKKLIKEYEGEVWCISKHLLAASMRLMEVGTKALGQGKKEEAYDLFQKAYDLYALFWGLNLKVIKADDVKQIDEQAVNKHDEEKKGFLGKLGDLVKKAIDCCRE
ncbi:MAG: hypothetical protein NTV62_00230 [Candidatus Gribaldobacteria bacterium]|nr:hypothetical protein [Candidatus Gribaldobacteria bacterium]